VPVPLERFLAAAQDAVLPDATNRSILNQLFDSAIGVINLDRQATELELDFLTVTMATTATPVFTVPIQAIDRVSRYKMLALHASAASTWVVDVEYPQLPANFVVFSESLPAIAAPPLGNSLAAGDLLRKVPVSGGTTYQINNRDFDVFPRGTLRIRAAAAQATNRQFTLIWIREILSVYNSINVVRGTVAASL